MSLTDEMLAGLEELAAGATEGPWKYETDEDSCYGAVFVKPDTEHYSPPICRIDHNVTAEFVAATDPTTVMALTAELRRLRAENAELAQSLAESRANDQAAMGWLTSLRWASGDRGERMLPELVTHIEGLAKDAGRLDLLDSLCESYGFQNVHEGNRWVIDGPFRDIRTAADSLEAQ